MPGFWNGKSIVEVCDCKHLCFIEIYNYEFVWCTDTGKSVGNVREQGRLKVEAWAFFHYLLAGVKLMEPRNATLCCSVTCPPWVHKF